MAYSIQSMHSFIEIKIFEKIFSQNKNTNPVLSQLVTVLLHSKI